MLTLSAAVRIYVALEPVDMRKSFDGLCAATQSVLDRDPFSGHLFVYRNRAATLLKILCWHRGGWLLVCKRLERGRFRWPAVHPGAHSVEIEAAELACLLEGFDLGKLVRPKRWEPEQKVESQFI